MTTEEVLKFLFVILIGIIAYIQIKRMKKDKNNL